MREKWKRFRPTKRRLIQLYAALLYNANLKGYLQGEIYTGQIKTLCVPGLNCYSCPGAVGACPLGAFQNALASSGNRAPYYVLGILLLFGLTLGRTICGFLCPFGLIQELLHKIPTPKLKKGRVTRVLSYLKYVILAVFVVIVPLWYSLQKYPLPAFCKYICPAGTFEGAVGLLANPVNEDSFSMLGILFTRKFVILLLVAAACVFIYRGFCRFLCPLGAIYGCFSKVNLVGVKVDAAKCTHCGRCVACCKMDVRHVGDHECIHCGGCVDACPTGAIAVQAGRVVLRASDAASTPKERKLRSHWGRLACAAAVLVLLAVLLYVNFPRTEAPPLDEPPVSDAGGTLDPTYSPAEDGEGLDDTPTGSEVGMRGPDFTVPIYGGEESFHLTDVAGQVTVINFWATWCTPCVAELPHFQQLHETYPEIAIIAIHSDLVTDDVEAYLQRFDYTIPFALDDSGVITAYGGSAMLPQTIVLDRDGVIVYNQVGSVTYEILESLVMPLLE